MSTSAASRVSAATTVSCHVVLALFMVAKKGITMTRFRMHEPVFPLNRPLFIIWCEERGGERYSVAAGSFASMTAAWWALSRFSPSDTLTFQEGARIPRRRLPVRI